MRPAQVLRPVIACLLLAGGTLHPCSGTGQSLDVPEMRCSLGADSSQVPSSAQVIDTVKFHYYRVPITASKKANRDYEFLWSDTYRKVLRKGLADTLSGHRPERTLTGWGRRSLRNAATTRSACS